MDHDVPNGLPVNKLLNTSAENEEAGWERTTSVFDGTYKYCSWLDVKFQMDD
jgi:hypothetical protein